MFLVYKNLYFNNLGNFPKNGLTWYWTSSEWTGNYEYASSILFDLNYLEVNIPYGYASPKSWGGNSVRAVRKF